MCRSKAQGGRRCSGSAAKPGRTRIVATRAAAPTAASPRKTSRAAAQARWAQAVRSLDAAKAAIGPQLGNPSYLLLDPLARKADHARGDGNPSIYDDTVAQGRDMLVRLLVSRGDSTEAATAKTDTLTAAYAAWSQTPEA